MAEQNKIKPYALGDGAWKSPDEFAERVGCSTTEMMSTPDMTVWPSVSRELADSAGSSKQDSGYCSFTPLSSNSSGDIFVKKCQFCHESLKRNYAQSTPFNICICKKTNFFENHSPDYLPKISETHVSSVERFMSGLRQTRKFSFYEESMDTSLYSEEMDLGENTSRDHQCGLGIAEIGDENSIDLKSDILSKNTDNITEDDLSENSLDKIEDNKHEPVDFLTPEITDLNNVIICSKVNETTPTKKKKSGRFPSTVAKVTSMIRVVRSFSLCGIEKLDFLYQLGTRRNFRHVISKILSYIPDKDISAVRIVSKTWNELVDGDYATCNRLKIYNKKFNLSKENSTDEGDSLRMDSPDGPPLQLTPLRSPMRNVNMNTRNRSASVLHHSPPVSPKSARFHSFHRAGKLLKKGERLLPCPRCFFPSHDRGSSPTVQCSRSGCRHRFCLWCRNEVTPGKSHVCPPLYNPRYWRTTPPKIPPIGSKSCKRNLRRL